MGEFQHGRTGCCTESFLPVEICTGTRFVTLDLSPEVEEAWVQNSCRVLDDFWKTRCSWKEAMSRNQKEGKKGIEKQVEQKSPQHT